ncbi:Protein of unknown function [Bacillus wiedmannii]|nr:Protein of unknown function [Bacillus wiedmannii]
MRNISNLITWPH